jgi:hypothetical protein
MTKTLTFYLTEKLMNEVEVQSVTEKLQSMIVLELFHDKSTVSSMLAELTQIVREQLQQLSSDPGPKQGRLCRIHVSQPAIRQNQKNIRNQSGDGYVPVISCKRGKENVYGHGVRILDANGSLVAEVVQPKNKQLSCGARVWLETRNPVEVYEFSRKGLGTIITSLPK